MLRRDRFFELGSLELKSFALGSSGGFALCSGGGGGTFSRAVERRSVG